MFHYTMTPEVQISDIDRFAQVAKRFDIVATLPRTWSGRVRRDLLAEAVGASVALEGVPVTVDEVRRILAGDKPPGVSEEDSALVRGYREAMQFVLSRADDTAFSWSAEIFRSVHASVMARSWVARAGLYRDRQVWLTNSTTGQQVYLPPSNDEVPALVDALASWLAATAEPTLVQAAIAHVWLAAVQSVP